MSFYNLFPILSIFTVFVCILYWWIEKIRKRKNINRDWRWYLSPYNVEFHKKYLLPHYTVVTNLIEIAGILNKYSLNKYIIKTNNIISIQNSEPKNFKIDAPINQNKLTGTKFRDLFYYSYYTNRINITWF